MSRQNREWSRVAHLRKVQSFRKVTTVYNTINSGSRNPNSFHDKSCHLADIIIHVSDVMVFVLDINRANGFETKSELSIGSLCEKRDMPWCAVYHYDNLAQYAHHFLKNFGFELSRNEWCFTLKC